MKKNNSKVKKEKTGGCLLNDCFNILDFVRTAIAIVDKTGKIIFINNYITKKWGYSKEEFIGKRFQILKILKPESLINVMAAFTKRITGQLNEGSEYTYEIVIKTKNGAERTVEVLGNQLNIGGKMIGVIATLKDITERKKTEEEITKRNKELESFNKIAVGRELRIGELKEKIKKLEEKLNKTQ